MIFSRNIKSVILIYCNKFNNIFIQVQPYLVNFILIITSHSQYLLDYNESYVASIRSALDASLCLRDFPSQLVEKDNKPYVELSGYTDKINYLILKPIYLARNKKQQFLIEPSINSCRISFTLKKGDQVDKLISTKFSTMIAARAQLFQVLRRKPIKDYDVTLLVTNEILEKFHKDFIIELIINLISTLEKDLLQIKLNINTQCRIAATYFMQQLANCNQQDV